MYLFFAISSYPPYMCCHARTVSRPDIYIVIVLFCLFLWIYEKKYDDIHFFAAFLQKDSVLWQTLVYPLFM